MTIATDMLAAYIQAEKDLLAGKVISFNGRSLTRENLAEIRRGRQEWEQKVSSETAKKSGGSTLYSVADFR
ncbi:MAG: hypothetical protein Tp1111SUR522732_31 [Prokaryotic dsDNA virus sp.]|uniref:hypothetical protein n=1 Tax=Methylophaga sp. UBA2689 TaxID=1946878 RepID=UPI00118A6ABE|nr:hypothetical protein [Methylophaga sp. UBA2689]QDP47093.1 MAG: hypothetical protein Tp1111SUR522732_31 [Prokaryotic dsDNA virus sp.]|tara:strand:+ start:321 stop:533 length:213 start_codon:yes stop_codon:yes gene_type:complete